MCRFSRGSWMVWLFKSTIGLLRCGWRMEGRLFGGRNIRIGDVVSLWRRRGILLGSGFDSLSDHGGVDKKGQKIGMEVPSTAVGETWGISVATSPYGVTAAMTTDAATNSASSVEDFKVSSRKASQTFSHVSKFSYEKRTFINVLVGFRSLVKWCWAFFKKYHPAWKIRLLFFMNMSMLST